jgi:hypothetical protein
MTAYQLPQHTLTDDQQPRRVGVEIEMSGIELSMIVCQCNIAYGGRIHEESPYEFIVRDSSIGDISVELDFDYLKRLGKARFQDDVDNDEFSEFEYYASHGLAALTRNLVPCELISAPLPFEQLALLDTIVDRLRQHGARGTRSSLLYAFGVHLNQELPALDSETVTRYLKAFLLLQDWLIDREQVELARKLSPFVVRFGSGYMKKVLQPDYWPEMGCLIDDYIADNPTRNRSLDMLPLFTHIDQQRVRAALPDEKINQRPTLHYRLMNSDIDNESWSLRQGWNNWLRVEYLANQPEQLEQACVAWLEHKDILKRDLLTSWKETIEQWLPDR